MECFNLKIFLLFIILISSSSLFIFGQTVEGSIEDTTKAEQMDIKDVYQRLFNKQLTNDTITLKSLGPFISVFPAVSYTTYTGFIGSIATNTLFYTADGRKRISRIDIDANYTQFHQYWFDAISNIFLEDSRLHLAGDARYYKFPTETYGLGSNSPSSNPLRIDYSYLRFYQVVFREIGPGVFIGMGYNLDYHWNVKVDSIKGNELDQFINYQKNNHSRSSGISLNFLYDTRKNAINPQNGTYINLQFRPNMKILGSDINWQALLIEVRHYFKLPASSHNILALWSYNDFTVSGNPSYLDLPSIGWDDYSNTGREYPAGRYTGRNLLYFETEYRFSLTRNGLLGGVIFANAESLPESCTGKILGVIPGGGCGLRIKLDKDSNANLAIDYGVGIRGSHGFFFTMGEVF